MWFFVASAMLTLLLSTAHLMVVGALVLGFWAMTPTARTAITLAKRAFFIFPPRAQHGRHVGTVISNENHIKKVPMYRSQFMFTRINPRCLRDSLPATSALPLQI